MSTPSPAASLKITKTLVDRLEASASGQAEFIRVMGGTQAKLTEQPVKFGQSLEGRTGEIRGAYRLANLRRGR